MPSNITAIIPVAWTAQPGDETDDVDEPPEPPVQLQHPSPQRFERRSIHRSHANTSLLTKAILGQSDEEGIDTNLGQPSRHVAPSNQRRRSMISNISVASTTDLTSDTGFTSPSRTNTPSPPIPEMAVLRLGRDVLEPKHVSVLAAAANIETKPKESATASEALKDAPRKRCIQFACVAKPVVPEQTALRPSAMVRAPSATDAPRRSCIKFVCTTRPDSSQSTTAMAQVQKSKSHSRSPSHIKAASPSTPRRTSHVRSSTPTRPSPSSRVSGKIPAFRPKYLRADSEDLATDGSQFHEFASESAREEDWIRQEGLITTKARLTIDDTLTKENGIRKLAMEAEEEAEMEDEEDEEALDEDEEEENDYDEDEDEDEEEEEEDGDSDGYHTDEETGFADSDDDDDEDENMMLWTPGRTLTTVTRQTSDVPAIRRPSLREQHSDSSTATTASTASARRVKVRRMKQLDDAPDLPDSTDFVCGTLDEDRPLEEAYLSCMAARRNEKLRVIPQDIDPSFPASDPDNDEEEELFNPVHRDSDQEVWMQGRMEDLHHDQDRSRRRRKSEQHSPRKYHSPPPKRHHSPAPKRHLSPAPKARGRSPRPLFDHPSPRRMRSPAPQAMTTPTGTPRRGGEAQFNLAGRPGLTHTKSLPRNGALFQLKSSRHKQHPRVDDVHVRGAVDIVKGLEKKRQRRKEKFHQKYCDRARRGQIPERKPQPGRGAERMKELGLLMAGKKDPGNYVLSV